MCFIQITIWSYSFTWTKCNPFIIPPGYTCNQWLLVLVIYGFFIYHPETCTTVFQCHPCLQINLFRAACIRCPADACSKINKYFHILNGYFQKNWSFFLVWFWSLTGDLPGLPREISDSYNLKFHMSELYGHLSFLFLHFSFAVLSCCFQTYYKNDGFNFSCWI